ncbi:MAG: DJ-1/PfpI family protein, partial [Candidatus Methanofastidiosia archaeon]
MRVGILVFEGVEELDFVGVYEVLSKVKTMVEEKKLEVKPLEVETFGLQDEVRCAQGLILKPHKNTLNFDSYDVVVLPGGRGVLDLEDEKRLLENLKKFSEEKILCSVCTGAFLLAWSGVLKGRKATTHQNAKKALRKYCEVLDERVVVDKNIITAGGVSCSLD